MRSCAFLATSSEGASLRVLVNSWLCLISLYLILQQLHNIAIGDERHKEEKQDEAGGVDDTGELLRNRTADGGFNSEKEKSPAVQRWDRKQIDDGEVNGDERGEREEGHEPEHPRFAHQPCNTHGPG